MQKFSGSRTTSECLSTSDQPELRQDEVRDKQEVILEKIDLESDCVKNSDKQEVGLQKIISESVCENGTDCERINIVDIQSGADENNIERESVLELASEGERLIGNENIREDENESVSKSQIVKSDLLEGDIITAEQLGGDEEEEEIDEEDDDDHDNDDGDDDGWITPSNIKSIKEKMGGDDKEEQEVAVGCLTTDFAMQVMLKI